MLQLSKIDLRKGLIALGTLAAVVIVVWIAMTWRHQKTKDPLEGMKPGTYQAPPNHSGETLPVPAPAPRR